VGRASQGGRQLGGNATGCQPCTGVPARAWLWRSIDVIRAAGLHAGGRFQVCSRCRLLVVVKMSIQASAERFCKAPPRTSKCMAPASRRMQAAAQADLGSLGCSLTRCFPLEELPYHRGERGRVIQPGAAPQRGDKAHGRLKGGRRRLGLVMRGRRAAHVAGSHTGGVCDFEGSDERIDMEWHHRVGRGTALEGAGGRCGSRPLTAASWHRGQRTQRPACLDLKVLRQARKAQHRVDTRSGAVVKARDTTVA